jgi:hypothetical protein
LPLLDALLLPLLDPQPATAASAAAPIAAAAISRDFIRSPHLQESWSRHFSIVGAVAARNADGWCEVMRIPSASLCLA